MDYKDINENSMRTEESEQNQFKTDVKDVSEFSTGSGGKILKDDVSDQRGGQNVSQGAAAQDVNTPGDVNMEASLSPDDVMRAGGFGARDDISSFLPVASDSTDFEATIRDAREYEEPQERVSRPGLGWTETTKKE